MFLILGSGVPRNRDGSLKLGSGDPKTRYGFQHKNGLFLVLKTQKILKHIPKLYPQGILLIYLCLVDFGSKGVPNSRYGCPSFRVLASENMPMYGQKSTLWGFFNF